MPRKVFVAGEILTAADVNTNLMDQAVMVFDDDAARTTAIPTPVEGMVTYLSDVNQVQAFTGSAFTAVGGILQVVSTVTTTPFSTSSGSPVDITGHTVTITPSSAGSTLFVLGQVNSQNSAQGSPEYQLQRDSGNVFPAQIITHSTAGAILTMALTFSQSAGSTSATTYKLKAKTPSGTLTVRTGTLTVMEVAG